MMIFPLLQGFRHAPMWHNNWKQLQAWKLHKYTSPVVGIHSFLTISVQPKQKQNLDEQIDWLVVEPPHLKNIGENI